MSISKKRVILPDANAKSGKIVRDLVVNCRNKNSTEWFRKCKKQPRIKQTTVTAKETSDEMCTQVAGEGSQGTSSGA